MDFSTIKALTIPEGVVTKITREDGLVLWSMSTSRLPAEYQEVEYLYIDKNEQAYIDLGFTYDGGAIVEIGQYIYDDSTVYIFGATESSGTLRCALSSPYEGSITAYGTKEKGYVSIGLKYLTSANNNIRIIYKAGAWKGFNYTAGYQAGPTPNLDEYTMSNNLYLFGQNYNGTPRYGGKRRVHYFRYYDKDNVLLCDLVPCYRKSDKLAGMYDLVRNMFMTNALNNGVEFVVGPEVNEDFNEELFTNLIDSAIDDAGMVYMGFGFADGRRWSSSGNAETLATDGRLSGWIPYTIGDVYRYKNFYMKNGYVNGSYVVYKKTDGTTFAETTNVNGTSVYTVNMSNDICTFTATKKDIVSFRISGYSGGLDPIVTKNEEIPI